MPESTYTTRPIPLNTCITLPVFHYNNHTLITKLLAVV